MGPATLREQLFIGGEWVPAQSGKTFEKAGHASDEPSTVTAAAGAEDAAHAADAAHEAFAFWSETTPGIRARLLEAAADGLERRVDEVAAVMTSELGATRGWGMFNSQLGAAMFRHAAGLAHHVTGELIPSDTDGLTALAIRQPVGTVVGIAPWNAPVILAARAIASPLGCGNTVVLKASEECPRTHALLVRILEEAGMPAGIVNLVSNAREDAAEVVNALIAHPSVSRINFTGSTQVGRLIAIKAAECLKRTVLELGGKAPLIVLADADLDEAIAAASFGAFMNSGQICMSTERLLVDRGVADQVVAGLAERAASLRVGDPRYPETQVGPLIDEGAGDRLQALLDDAVAKGASVEVGGDRDGPLFWPTVVTGVGPEMRLYGEESFGPVVTVTAVDGPDEAVEIANDTEYGLSAAVFTRDIELARAIAARVQSGMCHINGATVHDEPQMPFGGVKASGWGRFGGRAGLEEFTELRWVTSQHGSRHYPI